ncbi:MAG: gluconokinase [Candidatus Flexifilum sp.]
MTILVIDVGSSSIRALQFDEQLQLLPHSIHRIEHRFSPEGTADAEHLRELIEICIDRALETAAGRAIAAVGMATFVGNLLGVDEHGAPVTPLFTYADTRSDHDAELLRQKFDLHDAHRRTGCRIHPAYHPAKLAWLRRTHPDRYERVQRWLDLATYCYETWFGHPVPTSYSIASWSGLLNRHTLTWDADWLVGLGIAREQLPALADFDDVQSGLAPIAARRWPALQEVPFYLALGDGAAANIGTGGDSPTRPVLTVGTTAAVRIVTHDPAPVDPGLWAYRVDARRHLIGGATSEGGSIFAWARDVLRLDAPNVELALGERPLGAHGLTVLPLLAGERSPGYHAGATGVIQGLRLQTSALDIVQALLEGVALRLRIIYDRLGRPGDFLLAGGGALVQSPAWTQMLADILGKPLILSDVPEATALGVARLIANDTPGETAHATKYTFRPRSGSAAAAETLLEQHLRLYEMFYSADG